ncbi:MAG TPA: class I tRNA ligase family protein, partial [Candidatus Pacearchaeota archaeon]|nr:class I tRNA ligase family protein [Candidatus Pacearchaeota archaeon]
MNKEEEILKFWEDNDIFHKSIENRKGSPYFSFYDGPPFATGKPHYGHILATTIKDAVLRYWTMRGYQVPRRVGWDCHGLPVENLIEKELGIKNKKQIEEMGIQKFNDACRNSVFACVDDFQETLKRVGRWADYDHAYSTLDSNYTESVWWVLKQLWDKELVNRNYRVSPYCPRCGTTLSNFEVNQGYKETRDKSIYVKFKIIDNKEFEDAYLLVWTTTP